MPKFRKLPVVIEAEQYFDGEHSMARLAEFVDDGSLYMSKDGPRIRTPEGPHLVRSGDWIIKGVVGEFYPCKPEIFAETYERVERG